jgi:hypothetical protein
VNEEHQENLQIIAPPLELELPVVVDEEGLNAMCEKSFPWGWVLAAGVGGLLLGYYVGKRR